MRYLPLLALAFLPPSAFGQTPQCAVSAVTITPHVYSTRVNYPGENGWRRGASINLDLDLKNNTGREISSISFSTSDGHSPGIYDYDNIPVWFAAGEVMPLHLPELVSLNGSYRSIVAMLRKIRFADGEIQDVGCILGTAALPDPVALPQESLTASNIRVPTAEEYRNAGPVKIGGAVSPPVLIYSAEPEFTEQARKAKISGNVLVNLWVDNRGLPMNVHVLRGVGMGLDETALDAVSQYRFKPAMKNGAAVMTELNVEVNFQTIHDPAPKRNVAANWLRGRVAPQQ